MDIINKRPGLTALVAFIAGLIIGLVVLGWWLFPVQYSGVDPVSYTHLTLPTSDLV